MTAQPTAVPSSPPKPVHGGNTALAALFAAAAANSMHRQKSSPTTSPLTTSNNNTINNNSDAATTAAAMLASFKSSTPSSSPSSRKQTSQGTTTIDKDSGNSAAQLIASLLNSASKQQKESSDLKQTKSSINGGTNGCSNKHQKSTIMAQLNPKATKIPATKHAAVPNPFVTANNVSPTKTMVQQTAKFTNVTRESEPNDSVELRNLQTWQDEDEELMDESCYQELVDSGNTNGWSADDMFKYNEKRHKITSSYDEKTLGDKYTTPLPQNKSRTTVRMATKLAKEIEDKVQLEGRITPESSDDDEMFELERTRRIQLKQQKQLDHTRNLKTINNLSIHSQNGRSSNNYHNHVDLSGSSGSSDGGGSSTTTNGHTKTNNRRPSSNQHHIASGSRRVSNKSSSRHSNSSTTPVTASLSSSPTLNDSISHHNVIKMTSSSRNILRTCLI